MSDVRSLASAGKSADVLLVETAVMAAIPVITLVDLLLHPRWGVWGILAATVAFLVMEVRHLTASVRRTSLALAVATVVLLPALPDPLPMLEWGIRIGGLIASLLVAVNLLSRAVSRIPCIRDVLDSLYRLPPGKRYLGLSVASQFFGGLLGLAGIAMVMEGAARQDSVDESQKISSFTAIARGYSALSLWSPMYSNMSIVLSLYQGAHWALVLPVALAITAVFIFLGTVLDRFGRRPSADAPGTGGGALLCQSWPVMLGMSVFLGFMVLTSQNLGLPISAVIIAVAPVAAWMVNAWLLRAPRIALRAGARQVASDMSGFRTMASEVLMFLASGCAGTVIGSAIPTAWTAALGQLVAGSPAIACFTVSGAIVLMSATAIHPMLSAMIVGTSLTLDILGIPLLVHLTAVLVGWGLAIIVTPFSVLSLMASRWSGIPVLVISLRANACFVLLALATSSTLLGVMARTIAH